MAVDFATLRRSIRLRTAGLVDDSSIESLAIGKLSELWDNWGWSFKYATAILATVAPKSDGTVTLNVDHTKVDGTSTAFVAADVGAELIVGNANSRYPITAVNVGTQQLTLADAYVGATFTASTYRLQRAVYALEPDFLDMLTPTYWRVLAESTARNLDRADGRQAFTSNMPFSFAYVGLDASGVPLARVHPVPSAAIAINYSYRKALPPLTDGTMIPFDTTSLVYLCAADALSLKAIEMAESNPGAAQLLITRADNYQVLGQNALESFRYADLRRAGAAKAVRDEGADGSFSDDYLVSHDLYSPI